MQETEFARQIQEVSGRVETLHQRSHGHSGEQPELLVEAFTELHTALEELKVAEEELREQNNELMLTREVVEAERQSYRELFEFAPDGYITTNAQGMIREANQIAAT